MMAPLALLPFFQFFRGTPHQLAAVKQLEDSLPQELLDEDAAWFDAWRASGMQQQIFGVPYFRQLESSSGYGERECFSAAAAMVAAFYDRASSLDLYNGMRAKIGETTSVEVQLETLRLLGLEARFSRNVTSDEIEQEITAGRPVLVGWLHQGNMLRGEPPMCGSTTCGHWSVIVGMDPDYWYMHDPLGMPRIEEGGHDRSIAGDRVAVSRPAFYQRWSVDGPATGWAVFVRGE